MYTKKKLIIRALKDSSYAVEYDNFGVVITPVDNPGANSVRFWDDGTITQLGIDLSVSKNMRVRDAAKALGLDTP